MSVPDHPARARLLDRRRFLGESCTGLGAIATASLLCEAGLLAAPRTDERPCGPHHSPRAHRVLVVFCSGALSHVDTFDHKPELIRRHGSALPGAEGLVTFQGKQGAVTRSPWTFRPRGRSGKQVSDLLPHLAGLVDEMCFVHSLTTTTNTHGPGENVMSTGFVQDGFPSTGSWVGYGLGSLNRDLPTFVAIPDPRGVPQASVNNWSNGFLSAVHQGTPLGASRGIAHLARPDGISPDTDRATRAFARWLNRRHLDRHPGDAELEARLASYELAARMQLSVPDVLVLGSEPPHTLRLYGADSPNPIKASYARNCILARRLLERGVRFVQLFNGAYAMGEGVGNWDGHKLIAEQYPGHAEILDQPTAALLVDLRRRGLLEDTLVVFTTEFGRMPTFQAGASGRDHNPDGFTVWLAGAGVKAGHSHGATDEFGHRAVEDVCTVHDLHATILYLLGLDHERLTVNQNGLERRLTDVSGRVIEGILA
ncbi:MAG: DUF1501 domain-containing protein [Planctomycetes bacterium]|nr:DUF1501 domain-containing protein [Planctomycetota bacterium]